MHSHRRMRKVLYIAVFTFFGWCSVNAGTPRPRQARNFLATAYAQRGITRSGAHVRRGMVAADPSVLPLGARILVRRAGQYSGTYTVADTGAKVRGRHIDIFVPNAGQARRFGRKTVEVRVLK